MKSSFLQNILLSIIAICLILITLSQLGIIKQGEDVRVRLNSITVGNGKGYDVVPVRIIE